ncbi:hypothetical protein JOD24_000153 [Kroppenstedtia sanguinis]|uniref:Uncharacterized protein n=1 Tax=Kroppenstedtia sanguinis TaxID=1380684 RepID=A0ABW4C7B4_9BACL
MGAKRPLYHGHYKPKELKLWIKVAPWALQFEIKDAPQALQSKGAEALN